ncbi:MAG: methylenetetrahydrofolate reductase [NAD(P)H] [Leptonema sp. (in: Bacteria)]|nr:methylenetetrahydrofolate reductase [NAD(P)H] [Leptonema sp. (in: bacteria)]
MYKISEKLKELMPVFSFEFFPPKNSEGEDLLMHTIRELKPLNPGYVSVTYGAGGSTRSKTRDWVRSIQNDFGIAAMAHLTCVGASRDEIRSILDDLYSDGIRNIMALRGDPPKGQDSFAVHKDGFRYASELIEFIRSTGYDFSIGAAAYPEVHCEAVSAKQDLINLKTKVDAGADFLITQLFFDNQKFFDFRSKAIAAGISIPLIPGIMPITAFRQIERFTLMAGCSFPEDLIDSLTSVQDAPDQLLKLSLDFSLNQCEELLKNEVPGIHFYTLNQSKATATILDRLNQSRIISITG